MTSGFAAVRRRPTSRKSAVMISRLASGSLSQSRAMSGAWLAARAPTNSAISRLLLRARLHCMKRGEEFLVAHPGEAEVVAQEISVETRREEGDVVSQECLHHLGRKLRITRNHLP